MKPNLPVLTLTMSKGFEIGLPTPEICALPLVPLALNNPVVIQIESQFEQCFVCSVKEHGVF